MHVFYLPLVMLYSLTLSSVFIHNIDCKSSSSKQQKKSSKVASKAPKTPHRPSSTSSSTAAQSKQTNSLKFPKLSEFFTHKPNIKEKLKLAQCDVTTKREQCLYKTKPKKKHCLLFQNVITELVPYYKPFISKNELANFKHHEIKDVQVNVCSRRVILTTFPKGNFTIFPNTVNVRNVEGAVSLPIPFGDFQLLAGGEWKLDDLKMKIKFTRDRADTYSLKGYSEKELVKVSDIGNAFDIDILPDGPIKVLLQKIGLDTMGLQDCRMYGEMHPSKDIYELAFSGEPAKEEYSGGRLRIFITKNGENRNLAVLLELQDYSPVTLLKSIYGPSIGRATILRDRNQTIALYVSSQPTSKFSKTLTAHGSGRWIHRDSNFDPGAYLLVTLPFPKRKAVDMKIQLYSDSLEFSIPDSENLYSDLALSAILPEKIMHLGVDRSATVKDKNNKMYSKIRILRFKYFLFNNTYLAAAESHLSMEEELAEYMPVARTPLPSGLLYPQITGKTALAKIHKNFKNVPTLLPSKKQEKKSLNAFFDTEAIEKVTTQPVNVIDPLASAEQAGLL